MHFYELLIKGGQESAREEATSRLGARAIVGVAEHDKVWNTTIVSVCIAKENLDVHFWYNANEAIIPGIGYPDGTLLFFSSAH